MCGSRDVGLCFWIPAEEEEEEEEEEESRGIRQPESKKTSFSQEFFSIFQLTHRKGNRAGIGEALM